MSDQDDDQCSPCLKISQECMESHEHEHMCHTCSSDMCHTCCSQRSTFWRRHLYQHLQTNQVHRKTRRMCSIKIFDQNVFILLLFIILSLLCSQSTLAQLQANDGSQSWNSQAPPGKDKDKDTCNQLNVTECEPLPSGTTCFGAKLPYSYTSTLLATDSDTLQEVQRKLHLWQGKWHTIFPFP